MEQIVIKVPGMSCAHCEKAVSGAVGALGGVSEVTADAKTKMVSVRYDAELVSLDAIRQTIEEQGYEVI